MNTVDISLLKEFLEFDPTTGELTWKERAEKHFKAPWAARRWNRLYAGKPAFTRLLNGYKAGVINGTTLLAHRVIWALHYGAFPTEFLDHIDGDRTNNAITNLREADPTLNGQNQGLSKASTSGVMGVSWSKRNKSWKAYNGVQHFVGYFHNIEAAAEARAKACVAAGFPPNHGRTS